ncbi:hypothetical protein [Roseateles sp. BYS96W]|uniref:Transmembrane protein n=1 Tax=Pelomonas nitida TaxID=3299027 RepID=A0ABW7G4V0_9BURK
MGQHHDYASMPATTGRWCLADWIGLTLILLSVDFFPNLPDASLDSSWMSGLTAALAQGAVPGRDLLFTYGPLAGMLTAYAGPGFLPGLAMALAIAATFAVLLRIGTGRRFVGVAALVFLLSPSNEALFYLFLGAIPLAAARIGADPRASPTPLIAAAVLAPALTLAKLSFLPLSAVLLVLSGAHYLARRRPRAAIVGALLFAASLVAMWLISGQSLGDLPAYLLDGEIIKGYTSAMEWDIGVGVAGVNLQLIETVLLYVTAALVLGVLVPRAPGRATQAYLMLSLAAVLAVVIKAAVVRHGGVHSIFPWVLLCVLPLSVPAAPRLPGLARFGFAAALLMTLALAPIYSGDGRGIPNMIAAARDHAQSRGLDWQTVKRSPGYWGTYITAATGQFLGSLPSPLSGLAERVQNGIGLTLAVLSGGDSTREAVAQVHREILAACPLTRVTGNVDIYPTDINCVLVHGMTWSPRPVFQSYSAYTPGLQTLNRAHIAGEWAPDHLFIDVKALDGRLPVLEEGNAWTCLARRYRPSGAMQGDFLPLTRTNDDCGDTRETGSQAARLGEPVTLSCDRPQALASFDFRPTATGRLASLFYKTRRLNIDVRTCGGETRSYRFVPGMAALPLPLSPLVENARELRQSLYDGGLPPGRRIAQFVISEGLSESPIRGWAADYTVRWHEARDPGATSSTTPPPAASAPSPFPMASAP